MFSIDHLVHYIETSPAAAAAHMRDLGFHATGGGSHTNWGTWNSLCYMNLTYIEWIGIEHQDVAVQSNNQLVRQLVQDRKSGEGLCQIAIRTHSVSDTARQLEQRGLRVANIAPGMRKRPDGSVIEWSMLFLESEETIVPVPFFIEWKQPDDVRRHDLAQRGMLSPHKNGVKGIRSVAYAIHDLKSVVPQWIRWFGLEATPVFWHPELQAKCRSLSFENMKILFCEPQGRGPAQQALQRGERPFFVQYEGSVQKRWLDVYGSIYAM